MPNKSLPCAGKTIRINKPLYLWIIVSTLQIIQPCLRIVVVPTIPNRIQIRNISAYGKNVAPGVIGIAAVALAPVGDNGYNVPLEVQNVIVECSVVFQGIWLAGIVIDEIHDVVFAAGSPSLAHYLAVLGNVVVGYAVYGFAVTNACQIIGVADNVTALGSPDQLPPGCRWRRTDNCKFPVRAAGGLVLRL